MVTTAGWVELEIRLPGGPVAQKVVDPAQASKGDCFSACISMMTGIDLEILPVHPPTIQWDADDNDDGWVHIDVPPSDMHSWKALLNDNGYALRTAEPDDDVRIAFLLNMRYATGHAVIVIDNEFVIDPAGIHIRDKVDNYKDMGWVFVQDYVVTPL